MTSLRERCPCGASIRVDHSDPAPIAAEWRAAHVCDRRASVEREVVKGAQAETASDEPGDRTLGFRRAAESH